MMTGFALLFSSRQVNTVNINTRKYGLEKTPYLGNFHAVKIVDKTVLLWVISCPSWSSLFDLISLGISLLQNNFHIRNKVFVCGGYVTINELSTANGLMILLVLEMHFRISPI